MNLVLRYEVLNKALDRLGCSIAYFNASKENHGKLGLSIDEDINYTMFRDSIVCRFKTSVELLWRYLRLYLEEHENIEVETNTPRMVIRSACQARIMSEEQAATFMNMVTSRNLTSHMYKEDIAEQLARDIPPYYKFMQQLAAKLQPV